MALEGAREELKSQIKLENAEIQYRTSLRETITALDGRESPKVSESSSAERVGFTTQKFEPSPLDELGRLVLEPDEFQSPQPKPTPVRSPEVVKFIEKELLGDRPKQMAGGAVPIVLRWLQNNLNDPYTMRILSWRLTKESYYGSPYWVVRVRLRAKNGFAAYVLTDYAFFIRRNKIIFRL